MSLETTSPERLKNLALAMSRLRFLEERERLEGSLIEFFAAAWSNIDPAPYAPNWHLDAIAEHLEAVSFGEIKRLVVNIPPRHAKTLLAGVAWNAWTWAQEPDPDFPLIGPQVKFLCLSYGNQLSLDTATTARRLIQSEWYLKRWGDRVALRGDQEAKQKFDTLAGGTRISSSFGGAVLGRGGDIRIIDDPHKVDEAESEEVRASVIQEYDETLKARVTDPKNTAEVLIMHRVHSEDLTRHFTKDGDCVHLMLPAEFDPGRRCVTALDWKDPRKKEGELIWPEKWGKEELAPFKRIPYLWAGQYQQEPTPRGGGIIKSESWMPWPAAEYPQCELILGSLDTASTAKEENDASALTIWGIFRDAGGFPKVILLYAWEGRLEIHDLVMLVGFLCSIDSRTEDQIMQATELYNRGAIQVDQIARMPVDKLLVENKNNGISVAHELRRLFGNMGNFSVELVDPKQWGDKVARLTACEPMFADEMVYAPVPPQGTDEIEWVERVIDNVALCPKTTKWDTPDSVSMALRYLRQTGALLKRDEQARETLEETTFRGRSEGWVPYG